LAIGCKNPANDPVDFVFNTESKITAEDGEEGDRFGYSVAVYGDTAIVGCYGDANFTGASFVFE